MGKTIGIIGAGRMGGTLARQMVQTGMSPSDVVISDANTDVTDAVTGETGVSVASGNRDLADQADVIILAVKPDVIASTLEEIADAVNDTKLVISIAAGIDTDTLTKGLTGGGRVVRVMPNTPLQIGKGASAYCLGSGATKEDADFVGGLFGRFGLAIKVEEKLMDAVTGLSGSGPAFTYTVIEALAEGGTTKGLSSEHALKLAAQTVFGAAAMVLETGQTPEVLTNAVTTPGGTTVAGLDVLKKEKLAACLIEAVNAAAKRSRELGQAGKKP